MEVGSDRIWKYFVPGKVAATCRLCTASVKLGSKGATTNLTAHMQLSHAKEFNKIVETEAIKQVTNVHTITATAILYKTYTVYRKKKPIVIIF